MQFNWAIFQLLIWYRRRSRRLKRRCPQKIDARRRQYEDVEGPHHQSQQLCLRLRVRTCPRRLGRFQNGFWYPAGLPEAIQQEQFRASLSRCPRSPLGNRQQFWDRLSQPHADASAHLQRKHCYWDSGFDLRQHRDCKRQKRSLQLSQRKSRNSPPNLRNACIRLSASAYQLKEEAGYRNF